MHLIKCAIQFFFRHIRFDDSTVSRMGKNELFHLFDERRYHGKCRDKVDAILIDSVYETTETHVAAFILTILHQGLFSTTTFVSSVVFLSRFKEATHVSLHTYSWRLLFLTSLLVADKAMEEKPIRNVSLARLFPIVSASELSELELTFLLRTNFSAFIRQELFQSFIEKLLLERVPVQIDQMVHYSDFVSQLVLPNMKTLPSTPVLLTPAAKVSEYSDRSRSRHHQGMPSRPARLSLVEQRVPLVIPAVRRGRSQSVSRVLSSSSFFDDTNSSRVSRRSSCERPSHVPAPPLFVQPQARGLSLVRGRSREPVSDTSSGALAVRPKIRSPAGHPMSSLYNRRSPIGGSNRWNNTF